MFLEHLYCIILTMADIRKRNGAKGITYQVRYPSKASKSGYAYKTFLTLKEAREFRESGETKKTGPTCSGSIVTVVDGVEMTVRALIDFLRAQGVTPLQSVGQAFDPNRHEAADHVESEIHPPNTVVDEFHRGYLIGDRTLRPARVSVAKQSSTDSGKRNGGESDASDVENN